MGPIQGRPSKRNEATVYKVRTRTLEKRKPIVRANVLDGGEIELPGIMEKTG